MSTTTNPVLAAKAAALDQAQPAFSDNLVQRAPANASPFIRTTDAPFPAYPAVAGTPATILSYQVPKGQISVIEYLAIVHWGGGVVDGQNSVVWRVLVNGAGVDGLQNLGSQIGSWSQPNKVQLVLRENDLLTITVESVGAAPGGQTSARIHGFSYASNTAPQGAQQ